METRNDGSDIERDTIRRRGNETETAALGDSFRALLVVIAIIFYVLFVIVPLFTSLIIGDSIFPRD